MADLQLGSRVGFGTASLHHLGSNKHQLDLLCTAFDAGIRYFDTAPLYGHGNAERMVGQLARRFQSQSSLRIATKVGLVPNAVVSRIPGLLMPYIALRTLATKSRITSSAFWQPRRDYSATYLVQRVETSLLAMQLDGLDIVLLHEPVLTDLPSVEALLEAVRSLKQRGLVNAFGVSASVEVAQWLKSNAPELGDVLQVEIAQQLSESDHLWLTQYANATFGHFRLADRTNNQDGILASVVNQAVKLNPKGTILFSSSKPSHIHGFVSAVNATDRQG